MPNLVVTHTRVGCNAAVRGSAFSCHHSLCFSPRTLVCAPDYILARGEIKEQTDV